MPDTSPLLNLPYLLPAQAQKHVTHNEALDLLDLLVQLVVEEFGTEAPPALPPEGAVWALGPAPTGAWAGHGGALASWRNGGWIFVAAQAGWRAWGRVDGDLRVFDGAGWSDAAGVDLQNLAGLGIGASSDATNRLTVASDATLLTHAGGGHQLKLNKAGLSDTASLLYQNNWSGRAEIGLAGNDELSVKVSADGGSFVTALAAAADGRVALPVGIRLGDGATATPAMAFANDPDTGITRAGPGQMALVTDGAVRAVLGNGGLQIDVAVTGSAVQSGPLDATAGRLMPVGAFGLGAATGVAAPSDDANLCLRAGLAYGFTAAGVNTPAPPDGGSLIVTAGGAGDIQQLFVNRDGSGIWLRGFTAATSLWGAWQRLLTDGLILGTVSQSAGVPTGALIERGSAATGDWVKCADGSMRCTFAAFAVSSAALADGVLYRSADVTWGFPLVFAAPPVVTGGVDDSDCWITTATPTAAGCGLRVKSSVAKAGALNLRLVAEGRWF